MSCVLQVGCSRQIVLHVLVIKHTQTKNVSVTLLSVTQAVEEGSYILRLYGQAQLLQAVNKTPLEKLTNLHVAHTKRTSILLRSMRPKKAQNQSRMLHTLNSIVEVLDSHHLAVIRPSNTPLQPLTGHVAGSRQIASVRPHASASLRGRGYDQTIYTNWGSPSARVQQERSLRSQHHATHVRSHQRPLQLHFTISKSQTSPVPCEEEMHLSLVLQQQMPDHWLTLSLK